MKTWGINTHTFHIEGSILSSNSYRLRYYITFELHGFSHEFPRAWKKKQENPHYGNVQQSEVPCF